MALVAATLQLALESAFASPGPDYASCAQGWANAMVSYASPIVLASTAVSAAGTALAGALAAAFATPSAIPGMESAFHAFAASVGLGMVGFAPVPPAGPVGFAGQFAGPKPTTHGAAAQSVASLIDSWMRTGVSTLIAPPNTVVPWS